MDSLGTQEQATARVAPMRTVSVRSVAIGLLGVVSVCGLTAYNDYVANNTFLIGNFLPIGLLLFVLALILLVNAPLHRIAPRLALTRGELAVVLCMTMVSCAIPSSGLMRYLPASLVGIWSKAGTSSDAANVIQQAKPPDWLFPTFERDGIQARANDPVISQYMQRVPLQDPGFTQRVAAVPWGKWVRPAIVWGILVALLVGATLCFSVVFRRQWVENERLPYPLANVYLSLIEEPRPGSMFNTLFSSPSFWIAAGIVFVIHGFNAMNQYYPRIWPTIPIGYNLSSILSNPPLSAVGSGLKAATLYFSMIGIVYFLQSNVAFSLWFSFIALQIVRIFLNTNQVEITGGMQQDQTIGAVLFFTAAVLFVARHHLLVVLKQMFRAPAEGEARGRYLPYFIAGWGLVLSLLGIVAWLVAAGATVGGAMLIVFFASLLFLVIARVVAETGLIFVQTNVSLTRPWHLLAQSMPQSLQVKTTASTFFFSGWLTAMFTNDQREALPGFMPQALRVADGAAYESEKSWRRALPFTLCLLLALVVAYFTSGASMLYAEYNYGATLDRRQSSPLNWYGVDGAVSYFAMDATRDYVASGGPREVHSRWMMVGMGGAITGVLSALRLRFANWPLHPVGYLLLYTMPLSRIWFSVFVAWLAKVSIVKYGGATAYRAVRPLFLGLIIGEVGAAGFWLVVSLVLQSLGMDYNAIRLLPT